MPAYLSHSIMGSDLYTKSEHDEKLFKSKVNKESIKTYSLGIDLANFIKAPKGDIHSIKTQEFLLNLIKYVKENDLIENEEVLAFLYGHIGHYFFDTNAHPLVYYIEKGCDKVGLIGTHTLVEGYIDVFMASNILNKDYMSVSPSFFNQANLKNPEIVKLIWEVYSKVYNEQKALLSYKSVVRIFTAVDTVTKSGRITKSMLSNMSLFEKFLEQNKLTRKEIINRDKNIWRMPLTGEKRCESFMELYNRSIEMTIYAIAKVNEYLYDGKSLSSLYELFPNISYDTGVDISLGYTFTYTRRNTHK